MFRKTISPKAVGVVTLVALAVIQYLYWRALVYQPPVPPPGGGGGGGGAPPAQEALGRRDALVDTFAGGLPGFADGPAWQARFAGPNALALAPDGSMFVADSRNHRIRHVAPNGHVSTVAGGGDPGVGGRADGAAAVARFRFPSGVALAKDGTLYVSDTGNHRICRIRDGQVSTLAGGVEGKQDGGGAQARFRYPAALTLGPDGALWVADAGNQAVRRVDTSGGTSTPQSVPTAVQQALGDISAAPLRPFLHSPNGVDDPETAPYKLGRCSPGQTGAGGLRVFADTDHHTVVVQEPGQLPLLLAGRVANQKVGVVGDREGEGMRASFARPCAAVIGTDGTIYVAEYEGNRIRRVHPPQWLLAHSAPPEERRPRFRRDPWE